MPAAPTLCQRRAMISYAMLFVHRTMSALRRGLAATLLIGTTLLGCYLPPAGLGGGSTPPDTSSFCVSNCTTLPSTTPEQRISRLARTWLVRGEGEEQDYAFYAYLLFSDDAEQSGTARIAAMRVATELFDDVDELSSLGYARSSLAVLTIPVVSNEQTRAALQLPDPGLRAAIMTATYDYNVARGLVLQIQSSMRRDLPRVALVGYPRPLLGNTNIDLDELYIVDLTRSSESADEIRLFRNSLESNALSETHESAAETARGWFGTRGQRADTPGP
jgi:hypothetical protein